VGETLGLIQGIGKVVTSNGYHNIQKIFFLLFVCSDILLYDEKFEKVVCLAHSSLSHHIAALADLGTLLGSLESIRANWYNFGLQLRVDIGILDGIAVQYSGPLDCLRETLKHWLKTSPNCKWKSIVEALGSPIVGANVLALELERKHCPQLDTYTPQAQTPHAQEQAPYMYSQTVTPVFPRDSSISHVHHAVHPQPTLRSLNPVSPHVPSCTDQPQVLVHVPTGSTYNSQSPPPPFLVQAQPVPVHTPPPHQGRSTADYHPHSHAVQPGLAPPSLHTHPSTLQHYGPAHHPATQTTLPPHFQPYSAHSLSPTEGNSHVHVGELEVPSVAKRPCYSSSVQITPYTTQGVNDSSSRLSPALTKYARYLRACYTRSPLPENSKFPPSPSKYYINLAYIFRRTVSKHESEESKVAMVRGEIDKIVRDKGLEFSHVAKRLPSGSYPQIVLVEGAPGVGKTTFAWEFCKKWGKGELKQEYSLVILLRLRDKRIQEAKCLRDLFYHPFETLPDVIAEELINSLGEGVLILLEGLDELPERQRTESSVFLDLIHGRLLPLATVLITTRPWASEYLVKNCKEKISQHIEILGFTKQQIKDYLQSVSKPDDDPSLLSDIEKYLSCYPQIHAAMYIPLNAAIVVQVYRRSRTGECIIPKTMTQLYTALSQTLLIRYLEEHPVHKKTKWKITNFSDLPSDVYKHFLQLCEVAYSGIKNGQKLVFSSADLPDSLETLGFMQSVPELYVNESFSHNFLHLTIQEYLAAFCITQLSPEEHLKHFEYDYSKSDFEVVMQFVAGLTRFSAIPLESVRDLFLMRACCDNDLITQHCVQCDYYLFQDHVNWMFETQDSDTINTILGRGNTIRFRCDYTSHLKPFHYYCLGYCIAHSHCQWRLSLNVGTIQIDDVIMLTLGGSSLHISKQNTSIVSIDIVSDTHPTPIEALTCLLDTLPLHIDVKVQELTLTHCEVNLPRLIRVLLPHLKVVKWWDIMLTVEELRELCDLLSSASISLDIISSMGHNDYCSGMSYATIEGKSQHTSVSVDIEIFSVDDVTNTVSLLTENSNLGLHLTAVTINSTDSLYFIFHPREVVDGDLACQLAETLHDTTTLKTLELVNHPIGTKGAMGIAKLLKNSKSLEEVNVSHCGIDGEGTCHLAQALCENTTLKELDLSFNPIGPDGALALGEMLCTNTSLQTLSLYDNYGEEFVNNDPDTQLGKEDVYKFLEAMTVNSTLQGLILPWECYEDAKTFPRFREVRERVDTW